MLAALKSSPDGIARAEAARRLRACGPNTVAPPNRRGAAARLLRLLASPLSLLLLALAAVNFLSGQAWGGAVIAVLVLLSSLLAFVQEHRSDQAAERLRAMVRTTVTVLRPLAGGAAAHTSEEAATQLVPGDVVRLAAGDSVPADLRILASRDLFLSQAALSGEAMPVEKHGAPAPHPADSPLDLPNIAFTGSSVLSGSGTAVVIATGGATSFGAMADSGAAPRAATSFDLGIKRFVWLMLRVMLVMAPLVLLVNGLGKGNWLEALQFAVAVAVGLTPELLPMVITVNLAQGALAMADKKVIVKRLNAIQNVGAMDILCTDKTGTLTQNRVILEKHVDIDGRDSAQVTEYAYLNSYFQTGMKNLLDEAVLRYVHLHAQLQAGRYRKIDELPFDFERRRMSVIVERPDGTRLLICKGAVEEVLSVCNEAERGGERVPLQADRGDALGRVAQDLNRDGFRVIAVATRVLAPDAPPCTTADERDLVLAGYIAFLDPPKDSAADAIHSLARLGIRVKVLTGDNEAVARHVCRHVGLDVGRALQGAELAAFDGAALADAAEDTVLFTKMAPQQKAEVIRALQRRGHVVGFLGDGINDSAALRAADVGISVDSAVAIAKESSDIILLKKSLSVLGDGIVEGRRVFGNITKYIRMSASSNFGNVFSMLGASALLPFLPMAPVQVLLNNLLYDVSQFALASDRVDPDWLRTPQRWHMGEVRRAMLVLGPLSSLFDYLTFAMLWWLAGAATRPALFQTGWFIESLLSQTLAVHIIRTGCVPFVDSRASPVLLATTLAICALALWLPASPLGPALGFVPLPAVYWLTLPLLLAAYLALLQWAKRFLNQSAIEPRTPPPSRRTS